VELRLAVQGEDAVLSVADDGIGIAPEEHDKLFESFFRASSATEHGIPGTGLGLAISQRIARAHGGELEHVAGRPRGSEFVLTLPLSA
jgi:signal transduction histidine kinase